MRTSVLLFSLGWLFLLNSCASPKYLPSYQEIDVNTHGSYIKVTGPNIKIVQGELIALNNEKMIILSEENNQCQIVPLKEINKFTLQYAQTKSYGWSVPVFTAVSLAHGLAAIFSLPINLITTSAVTIGGESEFKYRGKKQLSYEDLKMFARFPQGIPPNISIDRIK